MQIYYNQLTNQLDKKIHPIYIITGNESYQEDTCAQKIINKAKEIDFEEHEVLYIEKSFDWKSFEIANSNLSLFSEKKIIELRFLTKTVGVQAEKYILECSEHVSKDIILIFRLPELKAAEFRKKYLGSKNDNVGLIRIFPMTRKNMIDELNTLATKYDYKIERNCINYIADMFEGNMVLASQTLIKIDFLLDDKREVDQNFLNKILSENADYMANNLVDYAIDGNLEKVYSCYNFLKNNDYPAQYIIWSFIRSLRSILFYIESMNEGKTKQEILKNIWPYERKNLISKSIDKLSIKKIESYIGILVRIDMQSKNALYGNIWDSICDLSVSLAKNKLSVIKYT
tara:strand:- start:391 stop:1419 length:1029 start_codon:yes stop_codon:yes gene_type:complete